MGTFRTRVKKKGKRWIKGQSSNSNPSSKRFRNYAKNNFFKEDVPSGSFKPLTAESLRKHNDITAGCGSSPSLCSDQKSISDVSVNDTDTYTSYQSTTKTFDTFASDWSCCSNVSFNKLINRFDLSSAHHKEMLAVLAAVTEVLKANGGSENTTEYFAALATTLDGINQEESNENSVAAIVSLLSMCVKSVPREVLQLKFSAVTKTLMNYLNQYADSDNNIILKSLIGCLSVILRAQEPVVWNDSSTFAIYDAILAFIVHSKSKIRKAAQHAVCAILKGSAFMKDNKDVSHPASSHTAKYCIKILEDSSSVGGVTTVLHMLTLVKEIIGMFPKSQTKTCCETILKLMTLGNTLITSCGLQALHGLFVSKPSAVNCPATLNAQLINALYDYQPPASDTQPMLAWLAVMQEAFINLSRNDLSLCMLNTPKIFNICTAALLSERKEVINNATVTMQAILKDCIALAVTDENIQQYEETVKKVFDTLSACLKYQYHAAWKQILFLLGMMYKIAGKIRKPYMVQCLKSLAELRESEQFPYANEVERVFGFAIETMGPQIILQEIPLQVIEGEHSQCEIKRSWLLPLFKEHIKKSSLKCFVENFLPLASFFKNKSEKSEKLNDKVKAVSYELLQSQIWALLPSFSDQPSDIAETFPSIAKSLGCLLSTKKDLKPVVMATLRKLIHSSADNEKDKEVLARFAKNYVPILFNMYTTQPKGTDEEAARFSAFDTIKVYIAISDNALNSDLFSKALQKLESEEAEKSKFTKESILDLTRLLLPYQDKSSLELLYKKTIAKIKDTKHFKEEKKYYRLLEDLCACSSEGSAKFMKKHVEDIKNLLLNSLSKSAVPSRGPRIRCLIHLLDHDSHKSTIIQYIPEAVLCCKDTNKRCRVSAFELLSKMADKILEGDENGLVEFIDAVSAGLVGSPTMIAATVMALAGVIHYCKKNVAKEQFDMVFRNVCLLTTSNTREIVGPSLGFIKFVITQFEMPLVSTYLQLIVKTMSSVTDDCKRRYRQKMRDIFDRLVRKYGADTIIPLVPTHDGTTLVRLKALKKLNDRKKKKREKMKEMKSKKDDDSDDEFMFSVKSKPKTMEEILAECDDDEDEDDEFEDEEKEKSSKKKSKKKVYLQEDDDSIIDFTSTSANRNITTVNPEEKETIFSGKPKKEKTEFKTAPDGRLIILEEKPEKVPTKDVTPDSDNESIASDAEAEGKLSDMLDKVIIGRKRKFTSKSSDDNEPASKYQAGGSGIHRKVQKSTEDKYSGNAFKSKKAKGDIKKKGMHDPFAYIPLSRNALNKRKKKKNSGQFKSIVRSAKKGAAAGSKNFKKQKRNKK